MSVLIKGVDTPLTCWGCPCFDDEITHYCCVLDRYCDDYKNNRLNDCPLVEVPTPHGRLIDADEYGANYIINYDKSPLKVLESTPTIIEAEVSEG